MLTLQHHFIGTYGKNLLAEWSILSDIIQKQTIWIKEVIQKKDADDTEQYNIILLSDRQINDALNGPFQTFFNAHLQAYARIAKIDTALTFSKEDFFKDFEQSLDISLGLPEHLLTIESSTLKNTRDQLNQLTQNHYQDLEAHIQNWSNTLLADFQKNKLSLSQFEEQDFLQNQPVSELHDRFVHLKLKLPKLKKTIFDFEQYFILKLTLAIQSALNRMQQSNTEKDIEQTFTAFKTTLKTIHESETALITAQQKTLDALVAPLQ